MIKLVLSGWIGGAAMVVAMQLMYQLHWAQAHMVRAIGSLVSPNSKQGAFWQGLFFHAMSSIVFAAIYAALVALSPVRSGLGIISVTIGFGLCQGVVVSELVAVMVSEHHPLPFFRKKGADVIVGYFLGHAVYGLFVGLSLIMLGFNFDLLTAPQGNLITHWAQHKGDLWVESWITLILFPLACMTYFVFRAGRTIRSFDTSERGALPDKTDTEVHAQYPETQQSA